jgi:hypothetical protein
MKAATLKLAAAAAVSLALAAPAASAGQGDVFVFNNAAVSIHPYYKFNCLNTPWINFGGIGANSFFGWGPLAPEGCQVEFTYTPIGAPPPQDPVQGVLRTRFTQTLDELHVIVIGTGGILREVAGPGDSGR